ncbi:MAG: hypothetical protein ACI9KE_005185 [Polyangiales bacterium]|jgi:hypothetical protein
MAGEREFLRLRAIRGSEGAPVEIINCGGRAVIGNTDRAYSLVVEEGSAYFHITGTGDESIEYGFDLFAPAREPYPGVGLWLNGRSTNYEVDHVEIHDTGFAGVSAKTDPLCDGSADRARFTQRDTHLHHLYVHDTGGEGFYIGSTQSNGQTINCDGRSEVREVHFLEGVEIHDNIIENTGWDGAQVGMARVGCRIYRNTIRNVGIDREEFQMQGLQIGDFSSCEVFANRIETGTANGIIVLGAGDLFVHSNLIVGFPEGNGIYANLRDRAAASYRFAFNTIVDTGGALRVFGGALEDSYAVSNFSVAAGAFEAGGDVGWSDRSNVIVSSRTEASFVDGTYVVTNESPAYGAGEALTEVPVDIDGVPRADPPAAGAYAYRTPGSDVGVLLDAGSPMDTGTSGGDGGVTNDAGPSESSGGCAAAPASGQVWFAFVLFALMRPRRRR